MHPSTTLNDLILFAYSESNLSDAESYRKVIRESKLLSKEYTAILKIKQYFKRKKVGPSESTITNILNYSKALTVNHTQNAGNFSLLLN